MIRKNDIIEGIIIKDGFTISSGDIAIRSNTSIITPGSGTMSIDFKIDEITTLYQVADVETKVQVSEFVKISSKDTMDERYIEVHKDGINLGGIGSGFVYAGPGGELTTSLNGGTISIISVGATGATGPGGTINQNEIAFGTGTGITSSVHFKFDKDTLTLSLGASNTSVSDSSIINGQENSSTSSNSSIISGLFNNIYNSAYSSIVGGHNNLHNSAYSLVSGYRNELISGNNLSILGGQYNFIGTSSNSSIVGGDNNNISQVNKSIISGGSNNYINYSGYSSITGGQSNTISTAGSYNSNSIIGGFSNLISNDASRSSIIGGYQNIVSAAGSSIISSQYSSISSNGSVILGGTNLTLSDSNTVLVPTLKIDSVTDSGTASVKVLTYGPTKNVEYVNLYTEVTYSGMTSLISSNGLVPGTLYKITDRGDRGLFHIAISNNELSKTGTRLMLCPTNYLPGIYSGVYNKGVWYPGMTASANQLAIWGGKVWKNNAGVSGTASTILSLDSNWTLVDKTTFSNGEYEQKQFNILYDVDNDWIQKQWDGYGNEVGVDNKDNAVFNGFLNPPYYVKYNPCDITDWNLSKNMIYFTLSGFTYSTMSGNKCPFGIFNNVEIPTFGGGVIQIINNKCNLIIENRSSFITENNIKYNIINNVYRGLHQNSNNGGIESNISFGTSDFIYYNVNNGNIYNNTGGGDIEDTQVNK